MSNFSIDLCLPYASILVILSCLLANLLCFGKNFKFIVDLSLKVVHWVLNVVRNEPGPGVL